MSRLQRFGICRQVTWGVAPGLLHFAPLVLIKTPIRNQMSQICHGRFNGLRETENGSNG